MNNPDVKPKDRVNATTELLAAMERVESQKQIQQSLKASKTWDSAEAEAAYTQMWNNVQEKDHKTLTEETQKWSNRVAALSMALEEAKIDGNTDRVKAIQKELVNAKAMTTLLEARKKQLDNLKSDTEKHIEKNEQKQMAIHNKVVNKGLWLTGETMELAANMIEVLFGLRKASRMFEGVFNRHTARSRGAGHGMSGSGIATSRGR